MKNQKLVIWDWNGTLLNDVDVCVEAMNVMLSKRGMKTINHSVYKNTFTFPVRDYYKALGYNFNETSFEDLSIEYIDLYKEMSQDAPLQNGAIEILNYFHENNYTQVILSASEQMNLEYQVKQRRIWDYFDSILGLDNIHAHSKLDNALEYIQKSKFDVSNTIFIGDTFHDYEVANAIGCKCVLLDSGHQNLKQFNLNGNVRFIDRLNDLKSL